MVLKGYDYTFSVDKLDPTNPEEVFSLSVVLQRNNVPVTQFMKEFLFEEEFFSKKVFKYEANNNLEVKVNDGQGNKMKIKFAVEKIRNDLNEVPHEREGLRLLIGRYAIYKRRIVIIKQIDKDLNVDFQYLNKPDKKDTMPLKKLHLIERQGVNVYDLNNLPQSIKNSEYKWTIDLKTSNKRLINIITSGIQNRQVFNSFGQRSFYREKKRDIEGQIMLSIIEVMNIKIFKNCNPYVKITVDCDQEEGIVSKEYVSTVIENTNTPCWVSKDNPSGEIVDLGTFCKEQQKNIKFEVYNKVYGQNVQDQLLGQLKVTSNDFLDITNPGKEKCLILEDSRQNYIFLVVQSLFVSNNVTRIEYQLTKDLSIYVSPEQYFHYVYLQKQYELDEFSYAIPLSKYLPNYIEKLSQSALKDQIGNRDQQFMSPMLFDIANSPDKSCSPGLTFVKNKLCSPEEKLSLALKYHNLQRPEIEEGVLIFKYLWRHRVLASRQAAYLELQHRFWTKFLQDMETYAKTHPFILQLSDNGEDGFDLGFDKFSMLSHQTKNTQFIDWIKQKANIPLEPQADNSRQQMVQHKQFNLMFNRIWENETGQQYADTYYLIQSGVPNEVRVKIWKDLLKTEVLEYEEIRVFKKQYNEYYDEQKSIYQNFKEFAYKQDCLAFRQIDEDIEYFRFPKFYHEDDGQNLKVVEIKEQKRKMRNILRVLVLWSRNKKLDKQIISYSYTKGMLLILQRFITIASEEYAFWILNSMVRQIPRLFSTEVSCLEGGRNSVMRNEMTAFKAILRENLPQICDKLRLLGLPVDYLIYDSMTSFYSHFFSSEVVLRLWDQIIFGLSNNDKVAKKRALWQFMAPAYLILREKRDEIMNATSIQQVVDIYNNGCALTYNPDWIVQELRVIIKDIFVTGAERLQDPNQSKFSIGINKLLMRNTTVDKALLLEQTRKNYEADLSLIFNSIEEENKQIGIMLEKTNFTGNPRIPQFLDYMRWRQHVMARFKKVALKNSNDVHDDLYEYDEPELNREDMDLAKINVYLHQIQNLTGIRLFKMRIFYGKIAPDMSFQVIEERYSDDVYNDLNINQYQAFEYIKGYNHLKIEILDNSNEDQIVCELIIDLRELNSNRFIKKCFQMRNEYLVENLDSYRYPFTVFNISFFLQTHTAQQHKELMKSRNTEMSQFINSIKRKLPDRIDIFNKKNETEFVQLMQGDFKRIIKEEYEALANFLPDQQAKNTINDNFNFIEDSDFGNITLANLNYLVRQCFFTDWLPYLESLYKIFVKDESKEEIQEENLETENAQNESMLQQEEEKHNQSMFSKLRLSILKPNQNDTMNQSKLSITNLVQKLEGALLQKQSSKLPFSLRNFIVSLVLMSHCTVNEKFDILYDLFDWNDGVADGLDMNAMFLLIKTIFERNLYYWPSHELFNLVEMAFDLGVSSIYQAFWTKEPNIQTKKRAVKLNQFLVKPNLSDEEEYTTIDVTDEVLENINSYQRMFGNKIIDFNVDSSAFRNIDTLIKGGKKMVELTNQIGGKYRLVIFYQVSSERYMFEVEYDSNGQLMKNRDLDEKDDIDEYLKRNINKLYLCGRSKGISKKEFLLKSEQIPFLQDLIRVETLYRDRFQSTLQRKKKLSKELVVLINQDELLFVFRFQTRVMTNVEGDIQRIDQNTYRVLMTEAYEQDTISDIRERIIRVIDKLIQSENAIKQIEENTMLSMQVKGVRDFFIQDEHSQKWKLINEFDRLIQFQASQDSQIHQQQPQEIIMKMEQSKHQGENIYLSSKEEERDLAAFDCYSLYKHCDLSYEWRLCKIMHKEPVVNQQGINNIGPGGLLKLPDKNEEHQKFYYWIEFLHHRKTGQKLWLKRRREEILMSARYAREQQRNYEQETLKFIREIYQEVRTGKQSQLKSVKKNLNEEFFEK